MRSAFLPGSLSAPIGGTGQQRAGARAGVKRYGLYFGHLAKARVKKKRKGVVIKRNGTRARSLSPITTRQKNKMKKK